LLFSNTALPNAKPAILRKTYHMQKIIHIDMDCFYAAIEMRDNPAWRDRPIAVGGSPSRRGVLCTANYVARQFGVRSAMASAYAKKLCPELLIVHPNFEKYRASSQAIRKIFFDYSDLVEPLSLDEAFIDVTNCQQHQGSATLIAKEIRGRIVATEKLTASAGVAPNKFLAKIASDWHKPNGQLVITPNKVANFVKELPVNKIFGVGKVTAAKMAALNLHTCADLQQLPKIDLVQHFGSFGEKLYYLCRGIDNRKVEPKRARKSLSVENTYAKDLSELTDCLNALPDLFDELKKRLAKQESRNIHKQFVKIKFFDFQLTTAECISPHLSLEVFQFLCREGYARQNKPVRLLGIGVGFDEHVSQQLKLL
jgi:DNA polymerase IV